MDTGIQNKIKAGGIEKVIDLNSQAETIRKVDPVLSGKYCLEAIDLAEALNYKEGLAKAFLNYGISCRLTSQFNKAINNCQKSYDIFKELRDDNYEARALNSLANIYYSLSKYSDAIKYYKDCIEIVKRTGDREFEASVYLNLGLSFQETGDIKKALSSYYCSMDTYFDLKKENPPALLNNLGLAYQKIGDYKTSLMYYNEALKAEVINQNIYNQSSILANIGLNYLNMNDYANCVIYLTEALIYIQKTGNVQSEARIFSKLGKAYSMMRCYPESLSYSFRALKYVKETGDRSSLSEILNLIAQIYVQLKDYTNARKNYLESLEISIEINDKINETKNYIDLAKLYAIFNDVPSVSNFLNKAVILSEERNSLTELLDIYSIFSEVYKSNGYSEDALKYVEKKCMYEKQIMQLEDSSGMNKLSNIIRTASEVDSKERNPFYWRKIN